VHGCVNPDHLEPVTHQENLRRSAPATRPTCINGHPKDDAYFTNGRRDSCRPCRLEAQRLRRIAA
jgi:hypothetical protein